MHPDTIRDFNLGDRVRLNSDPEELIISAKMFVDTQYSRYRVSKILVNGSRSMLKGWYNCIDFFYISGRMDKVLINFYLGDKVILKDTGQEETVVGSEGENFFTLRTESDCSEESSDNGLNLSPAPINVRDYVRSEDGEWYAKVIEINPNAETGVKLVHQDGDTSWVSRSSIRRVDAQFLGLFIGDPLVNKI